jgi:hypothetical protein
MGRSEELVETDMALWETHTARYGVYSCHSNFCLVYIFLKRFRNNHI